MKNYVIVISILVILLLLPPIFKNKKRPGLTGPDLAEMEYEEIYFENKYEEIQLGGMLFIPEGSGPYPTAIIIHGSGASHRNSVWYLSVVKHLQAKGIAVLLPDKRGSEKSAGQWVGASFEELATDTLSAVEYVKNQSRFEYSMIGLVGMSQGGWIAPVVATKTDDLSFIVSMSGATVTTEEQLLHEEVNNIAPYTYTVIAKMIAKITTKRLLQHDRVSAFAEFDPMPYWERLQIPVFIAYGENDKNVPVEKSIERLKEKKLGHFEVKSYTDGGHAIRDVQTNKVSEEFLQDLAEFIQGIQLENKEY